MFNYTILWSDIMQGKLLTSAHPTSARAEFLGFGSLRVISFDILDDVASGLAHFLLSRKGVLNLCQVHLVLCRKPYVMYWSRQYRFIHVV